MMFPATCRQVATLLLFVNPQLEELFWEATVSKRQAFSLQLVVTQIAAVFMCSQGLACATASPGESSVLFGAYNVGVDDSPGHHEAGRFMEFGTRPVLLGRGSLFSAASSCHDRASQEAVR